MKHKINWTITVAWMFIAVAAIAGVALIYVALSPGPSAASIKANVLGQMKSSLGDMLSGTLGVCLSFSATLFMVVTFREQRRQHADLIKQSKRERFESTFFNMLSMFFSVRDSASRHIANDTADSIKSIQAYYDGFIEYYKARRTMAEVTVAEELLSDSDLTPAGLEQAEDCLGDLYAGYVSRSGCSIGYYFRYVHNMINFVLSHWSESESGNDDIKRYLNMIQAQMSDEELGLLFYDAMSSLGLNGRHEKQLKNNLDMYGFLENISERTLPERCHHQVYRLTAFRFLNAREREEKIARKAKMP